MLLPQLNASLFVVLRETNRLCEPFCDLRRANLVGNLVANLVAISRLHIWWIEHVLAANPNYRSGIIVHL